MSKKALISVLVVVILVVLASFSFMPKLEASAAASSEIVGSWIRQRNTSTGTSFQIYQFNKDGTGCWAQDGVSGSFDDNYKKFTYTYDPSNNQLIINDTEYFCSICENGMIISSGRAVLIVFTRA